MGTPNIRICLAQVNLCVGDIVRNTRQIITNIEAAKVRYHPDLIIFPELTVVGYPPEDLLLRPQLYKQIDLALQKIIVAAENTGVIIGYPKQTEDGLFNACSLIRDRKIVATYAKQILPNYGVFDEKRYFMPGTDLCLIDLNGIPVALTICEDLWVPEPAQQAAEAGAKLLINMNASPYHIDKSQQREQLLKRQVLATGLSIIYVNLIGGQDELVFDGGSIVINNKAEIVFRAPQFEPDLYPIEITSQSKGLTLRAGTRSAEMLSREASIYQALVLGVKDYVGKNNFPGVIIGLSGGIDSALTLTIAVDALGADKITVLLMPSRYTSAMSNDDALAMVEKLHLTHHHIIKIEKPFTAFTDILQPIFTSAPSVADVTEENIQARCRGIIMMALANKSGKLVLTTGNKSEMAVGYATLYGDMAGGFSPLKDVPKTLVYRLTGWRNAQSPVIPERIINRPPSAELRENQADTDSLPPYEILDPILERYIELDESPDEIIAAGFQADIVTQVITMVAHNEYKRRQAAPGIRISQRAFGRDRRYPITSGYTETG